MKKILSVCMAFALLLSMTACGGNKKSDKANAEKTPSYEGVSAVFVGDSVTNGATLNAGEPIYWQIVADSLKLGETVGMGVNGSCYSTKSEFGLEHSPLTTRYERIPGNDLIFIALGTNDFGRSTPLGTIEDQEDISFYGAMNMVLNALEKQCPDSKIILLTPIVRYDKSTNNQMLGLGDYVQAIKNVANARGLLLVDMNSLTSAQLSEGMFTDTVHPDKYGHQMLAQALEGWLKENIETVLG